MTAVIVAIVLVYMLIQVRNASVNGRRKSADYQRQLKTLKNSGTSASQSNVPAADCSEDRGNYGSFYNESDFSKDTADKKAKSAELKNSEKGIRAAGNSSGTDKNGGEQPPPWRKGIPGRSNGLYELFGEESGFKLEDREHDWLASQLREEEKARRDMDRAMNVLKAEHAREHDRIHYG